MKQPRHSLDNLEFALPWVGSARIVRAFAGIPARRKMYHLKARIYHGIRWTNSLRCAMLTLQISRVTQQVFGSS